MALAVGVRFKKAGRIYHFDTADIPVGQGDWVVVETARGQAVGQAVTPSVEITLQEGEEALKPVLRKALAEDLKKREEFQAQEREAMERCREMIVHAGLPMKLLAAEYNLDGTQLTFYFGAEGRVDFRNLVRDLNAHFKTRVELRQVGARDETKLLGGIGRCGLLLCCVNHLTCFESVSMKMAKEQDLSLNPAKISGIFGRLLCCLAYEAEHYRIMKVKLPRLGQRVITPQGEATVVGANPLKETVTVQVRDEAPAEVPLSQVIIKETTS